VSSVLPRDQSPHQFALFVPAMQPVDNRLRITDNDTVKRMTKVLRLTVGDRCILFDTTHHMCVVVDNIHKTYIECTVENKVRNQVFKPSVTILLPVLKQDDLGDAVSMLTACGVSIIQLVYTQRTHRIPWTAHVMARLNRLIIAAAEQSKCFSMPVLREPIPLENYIHAASSLLNKSTVIFFDPLGVPLTQMIQSMRATASTNFVLIVGPEADLTVEEKKMLRAYGAHHCALTPTILRASLAAAIGVGIFRSITYQV
jgi:RsmE family RNA methyltransferase